jgi:hypothetical protein
MAFELYANVVPYNRVITDGTTDTSIRVLVGTFQSKQVAEATAEGLPPVWMDPEKTILASSFQVVGYEIEEVP